METAVDRRPALLAAATTLVVGAVLAGAVPGLASADDRPPAGRPAGAGHGRESGKDRQESGRGAAPGQQKKPYEVGLVGDMPYGAYGRALYPNVISDLNAHDLAFSIFDGDTKNGSEACFADAHPTTPPPAGTVGTPENAVATAPYTDIAHFAQGQDVYKYALDLFAQFDEPVVYLPGDNEWTDCDRTTLAAPYTADKSDSSDRLAYLRRLSFPTDQSLGQTTLTLTRQSAAYPENVRWAKGPVTFVGLNVTGSDNNYVAAAKDGPQEEGRAEYAARNAANLQWIKDSFAAAKQAGSRGVVLAMQADMWDPSAVQTHFQDTKDELVRQVTAFGGPVVLVNGDSHSFEVDKPLKDFATTNAAGAAGGNVIENFTRVTTFGEYQYHWVSMTVDPSDPELFTFHQHIVAADVPAYVTTSPTVTTG